MTSEPFILYVIERHPVPTQTFLRREIKGLIEQGLRVEIFSLLQPKPGTNRETGDIPVHYFRWWQIFGLPVGLLKAWIAGTFSIRELLTLLRNNRFGYTENFWASLWATISAIAGVSQISKLIPTILHGARATGPATAAFILAKLCQRPFTFGAHAYDIYRHGGDAFLRPKIAGASLIHTTTNFAQQYLHNLGGSRSAPIKMIRRGIENVPVVQNRSLHQPLRVLSVGRLEAKKDQFTQIKAMALLKADGISVQLRIVGDGSGRNELEREIALLKLESEVFLCGAMTENQIEQEYQSSDVFLHTGRIDDEGDRDGLPNVIPEAMAYGLPVITTELPGVLEAVTHEATGLVVPVGNPKSIADAIKRLLDDEGLREGLGSNAHQWVLDNFMVSDNSAKLAAAFRAVAQGDH